MFKLFVGGLKDITTSDGIREEMEQFGNVKHVELMMDKSTGRHRGFAFVTFEDTDSVDKAVCKLLVIYIITRKHTHAVIWKTVLGFRCTQLIPR